MLSRLFHRQLPEPRFAQGLFFALILIFCYLSQVKPVVGLTGLGTVAILAASLVEFNRVRIWEQYRRAYQKNKRLHSRWHEPLQIYYTLNVAVLWPAVAFVGVWCLWTAYVLAR